MTTRAAVGPWSPKDEAVPGIGSALRAHWAAAKKVAASSPFFRRSANWLEVSHHPLTLGGRLIRYASEAALVPDPNRDLRS